MSNANTSAFPWVLTGPNGDMQQEYGMTKREYFAAHAPPVPDWFHPKMPEHTGKMDPYGMLYRETTKQCALAQWPAFYATLVLRDLDATNGHKAG